MNEAQTAIKVRLGLGTREGENPALRVLFYRLCRLLTLPIVPIFVFDGPDRPKLKRGINVKTTKPHWLSSPLKKFIEAFGFYWYTVSIITTCHLYLFLVILYFYRPLQKRKLILPNWTKEISSMQFFLRITTIWFSGLAASYACM